MKLHKFDHLLRNRVSSAPYSVFFIDEEVKRDQNQKAVSTNHEMDPPENPTPPFKIHPVKPEPAGLQTKSHRKAHKLGS